MSKSVPHGGDLSAADIKYGTPAEGWLDLSTGINRRPYPVPDIAPALWQRLPLGSEVVQLSQAARAYYGVPDDAGFVAAPGTQALIQWLPRLRKPGSVAVVGPTYAEHAHAWRRAGHSVIEVARLEDTGSADVVIVVNPNNPDGRIVPTDKLVSTAERLARRQGLLVVDEAFGDVAQGLSVLPHAPMAGLFVLRSLGKFFGLAGARVGFGIGEGPFTDKLSDALGPWSIPGPSLHVATTALEDTAWQSRMRAQLMEDADRLDMLLADTGLTIEGGTDLYRLARHEHAQDIAERLGRAGVLVRIFEDRPALLRFGIPGPEEEWQRFASALSMC